jgi:hypothetical protein
MMSVGVVCVLPLLVRAYTRHDEYDLGGVA